MYSLDKLPKILIVIFCLLSSNSIAEYWESPTRVYSVRPGDNWKKIGEKFDIPAKVLQRYNQILGKKIYVPAKEIYRVKDGETSIGIAIKHGMTFSELINLNNLEAPYIVKSGSKLKVLILTSKSKVISKKGNKNIKLQTIWPLKGKITKKFGGQKNGSNHDGIHILGSKKTNKIKATSKGEVVYVGNEVGSYGNLIIIQHKDDWFSSYGYLKSIYVNKGDEVKTGEIIGSIENAPLYFSLRKSERAVDPQKYLPKLLKRKK